MAQGSGSGGETRAAATAAKGGPAPAGSAPDSAQLAELLKGIDKTHVGAAMSKMISASIGDICVVMSKSPAYKFHTLADIEWLVLPAVLSGQYYVAELAHAEHGLRAPVACVTWARVSAEADQQFVSNPAQRIRLRPDQWKSGDHLWIVDSAGEPPVVANVLALLATSEFKGKVVKVAMADAQGMPRIAFLHDLMAEAAATQVRAG